MQVRVTYIAAIDNQELIDDKVDSSNFYDVQSYFYYSRSIDEYCFDSKQESFEIISS